MNAADMPKLSSPFVRKTNEAGAYVVTPEIEPGFEWVFFDPTVIATEKLHGTNVSVVVENGTVVSVFNRATRVPFFNRGKGFIIQGLLSSYDRGYIERLGDGQHFGELIGPNLHGDPHKVGQHVWLPFNTYVRKKLSYRSWGKYPKTYEAISEWFQKGLWSLFASHWHGQKPDAGAFVEGVVFVRPKDGAMAKLRRDMFPWWEGPRHNAGPDAGADEQA